MDEAAEAGVKYAMPTVTEPRFLEERRKAAQTLTGTLSLPAKTDEAWRRTSLEGLDLLQYQPAPARVTLKGTVPEGVVFAELTQAAAEHAELIEQYLGKLFPMEQNLLSAAQAAHLNGGVLLYVPRGVVVEEPLEVVYEARDGEAQYVHTLVIAEDNAEVTLLERYEGTGDYLSVAVVEVFPLQGARCATVTCRTTPRTPGPSPSAAASPGATPPWTGSAASSAAAWCAPRS